LAITLIRSTGGMSGTFMEGGSQEYISSFYSWLRCYRIV